MAADLLEVGEIGLDPGGKAAQRPAVVEAQLGGELVWSTRPTSFIPRGGGSAGIRRGPAG